ncbi:MAG TPA: CoA transferase [Amycolatopsis sp.]|nr:CoA transferase [Amycolatopsis sp.]
MSASLPAAARPLAGLTVVDLSTTMPGAMAAQFLADSGAGVIGVEPPGGSPLRSSAAWPVVGGGRQSIVLDLHDDADLGTVRDLLARADVAITTLRPATAARLGLGAEQLCGLNPRLVSAAITGWGSSGPWSGLKGYEGMVLAKLGFFHVKQRIFTRPGPSFVSVPYASWGAAQTAVQGVLAALLERESSGRGQHVEADLVRGVSMLDTWSWFEQLISRRWPDAYPPPDPGEPAGEPDPGALVYPLLAAPTSDGWWLQFAQVDSRLFAAMLREFGLVELLAEPKWKGFPFLPTRELRVELWELMLRKVGERTLAEWRAVFDRNPDLNAEVYNTCTAALDHPQIRHDGRAVEVLDPERGRVRRPSTLVHAGGRPLSAPCPPPALNAHAEQVRTFAGTPRPRVPAPEPAAGNGLPLAGVTVVEFGTMFAAPFGATMLTDLGARVLKVEPLAGDPIRTIIAFPESGGARVMQGKESIALDLHTDEGREIVHQLVRRSDVVLQAFRAGAAERAGVDEKTLLALNPDLVYVNAPGYGTDGPFGGRPAYAPSIGAAAGLALTDAPDAVLAAAGPVEAIKQAAMRLATACAVPSAQADGVAALGVASAMLLGLLARARQRPLAPLTTTMLATVAHALVERVVDYADRPAGPAVDPDGNGYGPLYRMYSAADRRIFLAAPSERERRQLFATLAGDTGIPEHLRSAPATADDLAATLSQIFALRPAAEWERRLTAADVGCVEVADVVPELRLQTDPELAAEYAATAHSPTFAEHLRMRPPVRFSRSATRAGGGCLGGEHTEALLRELGYDGVVIGGLRDRKIVP